MPSVRQACTLIPGAPVFQDHASVSCHLFNEALWYGQWFGKLAKYKMQNKQDRTAQQYGYHLRNRASTLQGAHSQLALPRNNSGLQGAMTNVPVSKWPTRELILIQTNVILIPPPWLPTPCHSQRQSHQARCRHQDLLAMGQSFYG